MPMTAPVSEIYYRRRGNTGHLHLSVVVDIFEAAALREVALRALADHKAATVQVDLSAVERLDMSALQILLVLRRELEAADRTFRTKSIAPALVSDLERNGLTL